MPPKDSASAAATSAVATTQPMLFKDIPSFLDGLPNGLDLEGHKTLCAMGQLFSTLHARFDLKEAKARDGLATLSTLITNLTNNIQSTTIKKDHPAYCSAVSLCRHLDVALQEYAASVDIALPSEKGRPFQMQQAFINMITGETEEEVTKFEAALFKGLGLSADDIETAENYTRYASAKVCPPADTDPASYDNVRSVMLKYVFACELARDSVLRNNSGEVMDRLVQDFKQAIDNQYVSTRERVEGTRAKRNYLGAVIKHPVDGKGESTRQPSIQTGTVPMGAKVLPQAPLYSLAQAHQSVPPSTLMGYNYNPQPQVAVAHGALNTVSMTRGDSPSPYVANNQHLLQQQQQLIHQQLLQIQQQSHNPNTNSRDKRARVETPRRDKGTVDYCKAVKLCIRCYTDHVFHHKMCRKPPILTPIKEHLQIGADMIAKYNL